MSSTTASILALDVGERRIGVAKASFAAKLPSPLTTLTNQADVTEAVKKLVAEHYAKALVLGLPRGLSGQHTAQTTVVQDFGKQLQSAVSVPLYWQDEAVTSVRAEAELQARGKPYAKEDIDALSATYILEDFLRDNPQVGAD